jgi:hypothetical protein
VFASSQWATMMRCELEWRDTLPAALQYSSTIQADSRGLPGSQEDNELEPNPFPLFGAVTSRVAASYRKGLDWVRLAPPPPI